mmetsp:Transcript_3621/g.8758  ORF Transcript_3621/g.8758 Transcript_3621/m.8758 type:complete len:96 (+) Transcript_3621:664-951(+)
MRLHILCRHFQDSVRVDVEGNLDLRHAPQSLWEAGENELAKVVVVFDHGSLALVDLDLHVILIILCGGEVLALVGRDGAVSLDEFLHHATRHLDA